MELKTIGIGAMLLLLVSTTSYADDIPGDCLASFNVDAAKFSTDINWALATGSSATMSCAAGEILREKLFVEGPSKVTEKELNETSTNNQQKATAAYQEMQEKIQNLPGEDIPGTVFKAMNYLFTKYQLAACLVTAEADGGSCWSYLGKFLIGTQGFASAVYKNEANTVQKAELLRTLQKLKPPASAGVSDIANARARWVRTQTALCRAIRSDCL